MRWPWTIGAAGLLLPTITTPTNADVSASTTEVRQAALMLSDGCGDIGGVFAAHGTDGRGDCESADPRAACHVPPADQTDGNYVGEVTLDPPFPTGYANRSELRYADNKDCWKLN